MLRYLQLAHNERHPRSGVSVAKVFHSFGRTDQVDREALRRLVASISRFLDPVEAPAADLGGVEVLDARRFGGVWVLDRIWERLGFGAASGAELMVMMLEGSAAERPYCGAVTAFFRGVARSSTAQTIRRWLAL